MLVRRPSPTSHVLTLGEVNQEATVYLVEVEDEDELAGWLARHYEELFEEELRGWYTDPKLWPRDRSLELLGEWVRSSSTPSWWTRVSLPSKTMISDNEGESGEHNPADELSIPIRSVTRGDAEASPVTRSRRPQAPSNDA